MNATLIIVLFIFVKNEVMPRRYFTSYPDLLLRNLHLRPSYFGPCCFYKLLLVELLPIAVTIHNQFIPRYLLDCVKKKIRDNLNVENIDAFKDFLVSRNNGTSIFL